MRQVCWLCVCVCVCVSLPMEKLILIYLRRTCWHYEFEMTGSAFSWMTTMIRILRDFKPILNLDLYGEHMPEVDLYASIYGSDRLKIICCMTEIIIPWIQLAVNGDFRSFIQCQNLILEGPLNTGGTLAHVPEAQITWSKLELEKDLNSPYNHSCL